MVARNNRQRRRVYEEAMRTLAELGPELTTMRVLGERLAMSPGHILYYFGSKDRLLLETLRWSEEDLIRRETPKINQIISNSGRLVRLVEAYIPKSAHDPRWLLWAHIYARPPEDSEGKRVIQALDRPWFDLLSEILSAGVEAGEFRRLDAAKVADRARVYMDGLSFGVLLGMRGYGRTWACTQAIEWFDEVTATAA
jgi:AcrR family transcriptional regulator